MERKLNTHSFTLFPAPVWHSADIFCCRMLLLRDCICVSMHNKWCGIVECIRCLRWWQSYSWVSIHRWVVWLTATKKWRKHVSDYSDDGCSVDLWKPCASKSLMQSPLFLWNSTHRMLLLQIQVHNTGHSMLLCACMYDTHIHTVCVWYITDILHCELLRAIKAWD